MQHGKEEQNKREEPREEAHTQQLETRLVRLSNLMGLFKEKIHVLEETVKSLEEKVAAYAIELTKAHKATSNNV